MAEWTAKKNRIEEATRKKNEMDKEFANLAKESLETKMGSYEENREAIMSEIKEKLKVHFLKRFIYTKFKCFFGNIQLFSLISITVPNFTLH